MDFNENVGVRVEQSDRSEKSQPATVNEKNSSTSNEREENREFASRGSNDSVRNSDSANTSDDGQPPRRKDSLRRENWEANMCEPAKDLVYQMKCPDGNVAKCVGENIWQHNYGDGCPVSRCDVMCTNDPNRSCKSGINISVVSRQEIPCENVEIEKPMYSVSFKRCFDLSNPKCESKRRRFPSPCNKPKKSKKQAKRCGEANYRCTYENCCGNCESYIMEIQDDDCGTYKRWQNTDFDSRNSCFDDCCCPRDMKVYPSNMSVCRRRSCSTCSEAGNCCSNEPKCDFLATDTSSKQCLQRVHFAKSDNCAKPDHSACSFCSRKCTPSKASLFVEIGESVADVCKLTSGQTIRCEDSTESLKADGRKDRVKRNKSDSVRNKLNRSGPKFNPDCKGRPDSVARSCSDRIATMDNRVEDCADQMRQKPFCNEIARVTRSTAHVLDMRDCRSQTESSMYLGKKTTGCSQQCEATDYSLLDDIRKGRIWSQLQDTYKSFVKAATTSICQIVKQSSKVKRSKRRASKERSSCGTCTSRSSYNISCADQCNQSYNDCLHEGQRWKEMMTHKANSCDVHCCRKLCYENIGGLPNCQMPLCQNDYWKPIVHAEATKRNWKKNWHCHPHSKDLRHFAHSGVRKRGGGETNQRKKGAGKRSSKNLAGNSNSVTNSVPSTQSNPRSNPAPRSNPNSNQQGMMEPQIQPFELQDDQIERATVHIDVSVQANAIRARVEPSAPYIAESMTYEKRVKAIQHLGTYPSMTQPETQERDSPVIQEIGTTLHPLPRKEDSKMMKKPAAHKPPRKQPSAAAKSTVAEAPSRIRHDVSKTPRKVSKPDRVLVAARPPAVGRAVQCTLIRESPPICGLDPRQIPSRQDPCTCRPRAGPSAPQLGRPIARVPSRPVRAPAPSGRLSSRVQKIDRVPPERVDRVPSERVDRVPSERVDRVPEAPVAPAAVAPVAPVCRRDPADIAVSCDRPRLRSVDAQRVPSVSAPTAPPLDRERSPSTVHARPPSRPPSVVQPGSPSRLSSDVQPGPPSRPPSVVQPEAPARQPSDAQAEASARQPSAIISGGGPAPDVQHPTFVSLPTYEGDDIPDDGLDESADDGLDETMDDATEDVDEYEDISALRPEDPSAAVSTDSPAPPRFQDPDADTSERPIVSPPSEDHVSGASPSASLPVAAPSPIPSDLTPVADSTALRPLPDTPQDLDRALPGEPFEFSKEFNGRRMHVSVQMQTSNTILTQILSEFQIGNRKRQVLMSIKLQTNLDDHQQQPQLQAVMMPPPSLPPPPSPHQPLPTTPMGTQASDVPEPAPADYSPYDQQQEMGRPAPSPPRSRGSSDVSRDQIVDNERYSSDERDRRPDEHAQSSNISISFNALNRSGL